MSHAQVIEIPKKRGKYGEGSCYQRQDNGRWEISFYDNQGRRRRQSFSTEAKARKALSRQLVLKETGKLELYEGRIKVDVLADAYKTYIENSKPKSYRWIELVWRVHLEPFFGGMIAERVNGDHLQRYIRERLDAGAETSTVNHELTVFKAMFNHGMKADPPKLFRVPRFPEKLREPNPRSGFVTDEQYRALQAKARYSWLRALLAIAYNFGFRKGELLGLRVSQIDLKARTIRLLPGTTKNDKGRAVIMTEDVYELVAECVKGKKASDHVFTWANGNPVTDFRRTWRTLAKKAEMPDLIFHDLRRSAVRNMVRAGISKQVAKLISGHQTDSVFDRYDITDVTDLAEATRKLEARISRKLATEQTPSK